MNGSDLYGYIKFMIQSGPHMGCRTSSLGCKEFWPSESRDSLKQICKKITGFCSTLNGCFCALVCFVLAYHIYLALCITLKEQCSNITCQNIILRNGHIPFVKVTDQVAMQLVYQMFRRAPVRSNQSSLDA